MIDKCFGENYTGKKGRNSATMVGGGSDFK